MVLEETLAMPVMQPGEDCITNIVGVFIRVCPARPKQTETDKPIQTDRDKQTEPGRPRRTERGGNGQGAKARKKRRNASR